MVISPIVWRKLLKNWAWPFVKTSFTSAIYASSPLWVFTVPITAIWLIGLPFGLWPIEGVLGLVSLTAFVVACIWAVLFFGMACIGLPVTVFLARREMKISSPINGREPSAEHWFRFWAYLLGLAK